MTAFDIRPFLGVGPLVLGMSPGDVHRILGEPRSVSKSRIGERSDSYPHLTASYAKDTEKLVEVGIGLQVDVQFQGVSLFSDPGALDVLMAANGGPLESVGFIVFPSIGVALGDFDSDQESDRVVSIFQRGRWDAMKGMEPYSVPEKR